MMTDYVLMDTNSVSDMMKGSEIEIQYRPHLRTCTLDVCLFAVGELYYSAAKSVRVRTSDVFCERY